jgi:oligopeptide transport system substrate-binding protein
MEVNIVKSKTTFLLALLISLLAVFSITAMPANATEMPTKTGQGTLTYARTESIATLNPHMYSTDIESTCIEYTGAALFGYFYNDTKTGVSLKPNLAASEPSKMNDEGTVWQIKIRPDAAWKDGNPITADDFMYSFKMLLDPLLVNSRGGAFAEDYIKITNALAYYKNEEVEGAVPTWEDVGIKKIDDLTIEITTSIAQSETEVMSHFAYAWTVPVYEELYESLMNAERTATTYGTDIDRVMCSGPFVYDSWERDAQISFKKNPNYVNQDLIQIENLVMKIIPDKGTQLQMFEAGELDFVELDSTQFKDYEEDPRVIMSPSVYVKYMPVNVNNPNNMLLSDVNFRKALFLAVDRATIAKLLDAKPANYLISSRFVADVSTGETYRNCKQGLSVPGENYGYDPEQAVALFEQALEDFGEDKVELTLTYRNDDPDMAVIAEVLQKSWPELFGTDRFTLILNGLPTSQANELIRSAKQDATSFDLGFVGWSTNELAPWNGLKVYGSNWANRYDTFVSERYDELWVLANTSEERFDKEKRLDFVAEMESIWLENVSGIPVIEVVDKTLKSDRVQLAADGWVNRVGFGWIYASVLMD